MPQNVLGANAWPIIGLARYFPISTGIAYSADTLCATIRTTAQTFENVVAAPVYTGPGFTINSWTVHCATAAAGAVYRIGVWTILNQSNPFKWTAGTKYAKLLRDVGATTGTIDLSATGNKTLADAVTFPANTWLLIGGVTQGATGANLTIGSGAQGIASPYGLASTGAGINVAARVGLAQASVSGALGDFTPSDGANVGHGVAFVRSA